MVLPNITDSEPVSWRAKDLELCEVVPPNTPHGLSFQIPTWDQIITLCEEEYDKVPQPVYGYWRIFLHGFMKKLNRILSAKFDDPINTHCYAFPNKKIAEACREYVYRQGASLEEFKNMRVEVFKSNDLTLDVILFPPHLSSKVHEFWVFSGELFSSRFALHCLNILEPGYYTGIDQSKFKLIEEQPSASGQYYYHKTLGDPPSSFKGQCNDSETKLTIRSRVAELLEFPNNNDVFLFQTGMSATYNTRELVSKVMGAEKKNVCFGFPYKANLKLLSRFGAGCHFFGKADSSDLDSLQALLDKETIAMLFCECPSNPLLNTPDIIRLKQMAEKYGFILVIDNTLSNCINIEGLEIADIVVTSLTKIFSGYSDVMAGSVVISPKSKYYKELHQAMSEIYVDKIWWEDAAVLEYNSRSVLERAEQVNQTAEKLADFLNQHPLVKMVNYPKFNTPELYNRLKKKNGGYGCIMSFELVNEDYHKKFFDALPWVKGPSIGTNFTVVVPFAVMAHYEEMDFVASHGVTNNIIRVSVGLEGFENLKADFLNALKFIPSSPELISK